MYISNLSTHCDSTIKRHSSFNFCRYYWYVCYLQSNVNACLFCVRIIHYADQGWNGVVPKLIKHKFMKKNHVWFVVLHGRASTPYFIDGLLLCSINIYILLSRDLIKCKLQISFKLQTIFWIVENINKLQNNINRKLNVNIVLTVDVVLTICWHQNLKIL